MKDEENMVWSASKVLIAVALIFSLVDPIDDVLMAKV